MQCVQLREKNENSVGSLRRKEKYKIVMEKSERFSSSQRTVLGWSRSTMGPFEIHGDEFKIRLVGMGVFIKSDLDIWLFSI